MPKDPTYPDLFDTVKQVTIKALKQMGYFGYYSPRSGTYGWTCNGEPSGRISVTVSLPDRYVELDYKCDGKPINYRVRLERLPKHFGGYEWYFICPTTGKRCSKLYMIGEYFLSRHAYPSAMYSKQTESKRWRVLSAVMGTIDDENRLGRRYAKLYYAGKPTKWFSRWLAKQERRERYAMPYIRNLDKLFG